LISASDAALQMSKDTLETMHTELANKQKVTTDRMWKTPTTARLADADASTSPSLIISSSGARSAPRKKVQSWDFGGLEGTGARSEAESVELASRIVSFH
jgi:hypothetical protein